MADTPTPLFELLTAVRNLIEDPKYFTFSAETQLARDDVVRTLAVYDHTEGAAPEDQNPLQRAQHLARTEAHRHQNLVRDLAVALGMATEREDVPHALLNDAAVRDMIQTVAELSNQDNERSS